MSSSSPPRPQRGGERSPAAPRGSSLAEDLEDEEDVEGDEAAQPASLAPPSDGDRGAAEERDDDDNEDDSEGYSDEDGSEAEVDAASPRVTSPPSSTAARNPFEDVDDGEEEEEEKEEVDEEPDSADSFKPRSPPSPRSPSPVPTPSSSSQREDATDSAAPRDEEEDEREGDEEEDEVEVAIASALDVTAATKENEGAVVSLPSTASSSVQSLSSTSALPQPAQAGDWAQATVLEPDEAHPPIPRVRSPSSKTKKARDSTQTTPETSRKTDHDEEDEEHAAAQHVNEDAAAADSKSAAGVMEEEREQEAEDEGEDEEEDEEEEPILKYQRMGADVTRLLQSAAGHPPLDSARCLLAHAKFLLMGTSSGALYMLDLHGNEIAHFTPHSAPINDLSLDSSAEFVASASMDGSVVVTNLYSKEVSRHNYSTNVLSVALPAQYKAAAMFASGGSDGKLVVSKKGWFSAFNAITIHSGEGPVHCVRWRRSLIAWANDVGVKVYDATTSERITHIKFEPSQDRQGQRSPRPYLTWASDSELLIACGQTVKIGRVKERALTKQERSAHPDRTLQRLVQITALFNVSECRLCGIAAFEKELVLMTVPSDEEDADDEDGQPAVPRPELRIVSRAGQERRVDVLPVHGFEQCTATDYHLSSLQDESSVCFFILAPHDLLTAKPRDADDHIAFLHSLQRYHDALLFVQSSPPPVLHQFTRQQVVDTYLDHLFNIRSYAECAQECSQLLGLNQQLWETWIDRFERHRKLSHMVQFIPTFNPQLKHDLYEHILAYFIDERNAEDKDAPQPDTLPTSSIPSPSQDEAYSANLAVLLRLITSWSKHIYDPARAIALIKAKLAQQAAAGVPPHPLLLESQAELYLIQHQYHLALSVYLGLRRHDIFTLIRELSLFHVIKDKLLQLWTFDSRQATQLLVDHHDKQGVDEVMGQLRGHPQFQFQYLHALVRHFDYNVSDLSEEHANTLLHLYAEYAPGELLHYLRQSQQYSVEAALELCERKHLHRELIWLYRQMGNSALALRIVLSQLRNVHMAIELVKEEKDDALWEELISHSLQDSRMLGELLLVVGEYQVDLVKLIERVPVGMEIEGLKAKLVRLLRDLQLQVSVLHAASKVCEADVERAVDDRRKKEGEGVEVRRCFLCSNSIFSLGSAATAATASSKRQRRPRRKRGEQPADDPSKDGERREKGVKEDGVVAFFCHHSYHRSCLLAALRERKAAGQAQSQPTSPSSSALVCVLCDAVKLGGAAAAAAKSQAGDGVRDEEHKEEAKGSSKAGERVVTAVNPVLGDSGQSGVPGKSSLIVPTRPTIVTAVTANLPVAKPAAAESRSTRKKAGHR